MEIEIDKEEEIDINMDRRTFVKLAGTTAAVLAFGGTGMSRFVQPAMGAVSLKKYLDPLVIPPALTPDTTTYPGTDYYQIPIVQGVTHKFHSNLPATGTYSYFGTAPAPGFHYLGPTIIAKKGIPVKIKFSNALPRGNHLLHNAIDETIMGSKDGINADGSPWIDENRICVHLHGGKILPASDGGPRDWFSPVGGQSNPYPDAATFGTMDNYTYDYPNDQPATLLWYHDHAWAITRFNPFCGMAAAYILRDDSDTGRADNPLGLPAGSYEVPIVLQDKLLDPVTGAMIYPNVGISPANHPKWIPEYFGDTPVVNGRAYPYHNVEPRRYRFRFINGSNARFYNIWFATPILTMPTIPMWIIGSEQGFLPNPVMLNKLLIAPGERFDVIVDFTLIPPGTNLLLKNNAKAPYPSGTGLGISQIMQFRVIAPTGTDNTTPPQNLTLPAPTFPALLSTTPHREIVLQENLDPLGFPIEVLLDGYHYIDSVNDPTLFLENADSVKVWEFINTTADAHPMHPHLVPFKIVNRQPFDVVGFLAVWNTWITSGRSGLRPSVNGFLTKGAAYMPALEESGWKDTAKAYPGEILRILTEFKLPTGVPAGDYKYPCHCHILEHEENDMMFQFTVRKP